MKLLQRCVVILGAACGVLVLYVVLGISVLMGDGKPSGSGGGGGSAW